MINEYLKEYLRSGTTKTPTRGRGHRVSRKNPLFENSSDDEKENSPQKVKKDCGGIQKSVVSRVPDLSFKLKCALLFL
jgi:hypothetical protein